MKERRPSITTGKGYAGELLETAILIKNYPDEPEKDWGEEVAQRSFVGPNKGKGGERENKKLGGKAGHSRWELNADDGNQKLRYHRKIG